MESPEFTSYALKNCRRAYAGGVHPMLYKNLTVKELYASIYDTQTIESFFLKGLEKDNDRLAVSAMEELILRGDTDKVFDGLEAAFERGDVKVKSTMATMIARSLSESCRGIDPFLHKFGKFLFKAEGPDPFGEFIGEERREEERKSFQDRKKPRLSDHRPADYFNIGDEVVCFVSPGEKVFKTGFLTGRIIEGYRHHDGMVSVCMDEKYHTGDYCDGHGFSAFVGRPEVMHKWEFEYFKSHPDYLTIWCNKSNYLTYEMQEAFAKLLPTK